MTIARTMPTMMLLALGLLASGAPALAAPMAGDRSRYDACLAMVQADPARAIESAQAWRIENGGVPARHCLALAQMERKDYAAALKSFEGAAQASEVARDGQAVALWGQAADAAMQAGQPEAAVRYLSSAIAGAGGISLSPRAEAQLRVDRARALVDVKRNADAAADLDKATKLAGDVQFGWLLKATLARRMGDFKTAEAAILEAAQREPDSADVQFEAGNIAAAQGNDQLARTAWLAAARADPDSAAGIAANKALQGD
nr:tetratricopeptide repeat protein [Polymorphobacter sp.]